MSWRPMLALVAAVLLAACGSANSSGSEPRQPKAKHKHRSKSVSTVVTFAKGGRVQVPDDVADDCSRDVTDELNKLFAQLHDGSQVELTADACYRIDGTVTLAGKKDVVVDGNEATFKAETLGDQGRRHVTISDSADVEIKNLTVIGSNPGAGATKAAYDEELAFQHAFNLTGVTRVVLDGVKARQLHGDFVYVGGRKENVSRDVVIRNSSFDGSGRQGIAIANADGVLIENNTIRNVARSLFDLEPNRPNNRVRNVHITGNRTGAAVNFWVANKGAGNNIGDVEIDHNTMERATGGLVFAFGRADQGGTRGPWRIHDNHLIANDAVHDEGSVGAFLFAFCKDVSLERNVVSFVHRGTMPAVELRSSAQVRVVGNSFDGATEPVRADDATSGVVVQ